MIHVPGPGQRLCDGVSRGEWLRVGGVALGGLSLPSLLRSRTIQPASGGERSFGRAKRCIMLFFGGGQPQYETWDPKPNAPAEIRGPFKPIASSVPGLQVCELMPKLAALAHRFAVLRACVTGDNAHSTSGYYVFTGQPHVPLNQENATPKAPNDWPSYAAIVKQFRQGSSRMPAAVTIPENLANTGNFLWPGQDGGWLGRRADPWLIHCDPNSPTFEAPALTLPADIPLPRFDQRRSLLGQVDPHIGGLPAAASRHDDNFQTAAELLTAPAARRAFEIEREPAPARQRYGRHRWGQSILLARRLIEAGVSLVQVNWTGDKDKPNLGGWDTHEKNAESLKGFLMPMFDEGVSALLEDLHIRGLLDETLVVCMGEFGRTPTHNARAGRDHWGNVYSLALAGGGIRGGAVHGASDSKGAAPKEGRVTPPDVLATVFHCLGIEPNAELRDPLGRPIPACRGQVIRQIL